MRCEAGRVFLRFGGGVFFFGLYGGDFSIFVLGFLLVVIVSSVYVDFKV